MIRYTKEQKDFLIKNNKLKTSQELSELFNKEFDTNITAKNIQYFRSNNRLNSGLSTRFIKGHIPQNKGKKWDDYMPKKSQINCRTTTFKKGNKPSNAVDIGEEHIRYSGSKSGDLGYLYVKICDGKGNKNWIPKQRYIYELHRGPIPPGHKVIFADGDRFNFDIDNLILVSTSEELLMNRHNLRFEDKELTKTGFMIAKVMDKTYKVKNDRL